MALPNMSDKIWEDLITGREKIEFEFLAVKIFLGTAHRLYANDPNSVHKSIENLHKLFEKNQLLPTVKKDILKFK